MIGSRVALWLVVFSLVPAVLLTGCLPDTELTGAQLANSRPNTRISGNPPNLMQASFLVEFFWHGSDPDGKIVGYQWKLSNNGLDGISVQDTLTFDPATGDTLNPWHFTVVTDTTFIVSADIPEFADDPPGDQRSYQTHTLWVRAVDDKGAVDPTPAYMSFTSLTLLPTILVDTPFGFIGQTAVLGAPASVTFGWSGSDPDFDRNMPTQIRYLWKPAWVDGVGYVRTRATFNTHVETLVDFEDSVWSDWIPYDPTPENRRITFPGQPALDAQGEQIRYLFAIQAMDTAGAVTIDRSYGRSVMNCFISATISPALTVFERFLGEKTVTGVNVISEFEIASGQQLNFSWVADASGYAGRIISYRYGWNVGDATDPNDPNWAVAPGNSPQHLRAPTTSFPGGVHTLTVKVLDNSSQTTLYRVNLVVVPVPDPEQQLPCLLIDDVNDRQSNRWPDQSGVARDRDAFRDAFWEVTLLESGGVVNFDPGRDVIDAEVEQFEYREAVQYRSLIWTSKYVSAPHSYISAKFRPHISEGDQFIWLASYQDQVGNLLYCSPRGQENFIDAGRWMVPIIFDTREEVLTLGDQVYKVGFGERELPDGSILELGPDRYPFRVNGVAVIDEMQPSYHIYARSQLGQSDRNARCAGMKALVLDPEFENTYMPGGAPFDDAIFSDPIIDWRDTAYGGVLADTLLSTLNYGFFDDEFYDTNISGTRTTPYQLQLCGPDSIPCLDHMFRAYTRFDWIRDARVADGDVEWPSSEYNDNRLDDVCGELGLNSSSTGSRANGVPVGFLTHKTKYNKPSQKGDVIWGFDPYRFDNVEVRKAIRWVLGEHFGLIMRP